MSKTRIDERIERFMNENGNEIQEEIRQGRLSVNLPLNMKKCIKNISQIYKTSMNSLFLYIITQISFDDIDMKSLMKIKRLFWKSDKVTVSLSMPLPLKQSIITKCKNEGVSIAALYTYITALYLDWWIDSNTSEDDKQENIKDFKDFLK